MAAWGGRGARVRARARPPPAHAARNHRPGPARRVPGAWACPRARHSPPSAAGARHFRPQNGERRRRRARKRRGAGPRHSQPGQTSRTPRAWAWCALFSPRGSPGGNRSRAMRDPPARVVWRPWRRRFAAERAVWWHRARAWPLPTRWPPAAGAAARWHAARREKCGLEQVSKQMPRKYSICHQDTPEGSRQEKMPPSARYRPRRRPWRCIWPPNGLANKTVKRLGNKTARKTWV